VTPPRDGLDVAVTAGDLEATPGTGARVRTAIRPTKWSQRLSGRLATLDDRWRYALAVYFLPRVLYLGTALVATVVPQPCSAIAGTGA
jgi:hypothetical protein